jgi:hypothetical protein
MAVCCEECTCCPFAGFQCPGWWTGCNRFLGQTLPAAAQDVHHETQTLPCNAGRLKTTSSICNLRWEKQYNHLEHTTVKPTSKPLEQEVC